MIPKDIQDNNPGIKVWFRIRLHWVRSLPVELGYLCSYSNLGFGEPPKKSRGTSEEFPENFPRILNLTILGKHFFIRIEVSIFAK
jgi:hypothetical protein